VEFRQFQNKLRKCRICKDVVGPPLVSGDKEAKIVHISQAPSRLAITSQKPYSDKSGEKLRRQWYQISDRVFYNPKNFYITAIAHCFPGKDKKGADKKAPLVCAKTWLLKEISYFRACEKTSSAYLEPKLFLVVGKQAAEFLFPGKSYQKLIFQDQTLNGIKCFVLPHPSPANIKWFKDNPDFERKRLFEIRKEVHRVLT